MRTPVILLALSLIGQALGFPNLAAGNEVEIQNGHEYTVRPTNGSRVLIGESGFSLQPPSGWKTLEPQKGAREISKRPYLVPGLKGHGETIFVCHEYRGADIKVHFAELEAWWRQLAAERKEPYVPSKFERTEVTTASGLKGVRERSSVNLKFVRYYFKGHKENWYEFMCDLEGTDYAAMEGIVLGSLWLLPE